MDETHVEKAIHWCISQIINVTRQKQCKRCNNMKHTLFVEKKHNVVLFEFCLLTLTTDLHSRVKLMSPFSVCCYIFSCFEVGMVVTVYQVALTFQRQLVEMSFKGLLFTFVHFTLNQCFYYYQTLYLYLCVLLPLLLLTGEYLLCLVLNLLFWRALTESPRDNLLQQTYIAIIPSH